MDGVESRSVFLALSLVLLEPLGRLCQQNARMLSAVPALPFLLEINWSNIATQYVLPVCVLLLIFLVPHIVAAQIFAPKTNILFVIAACVMQLLFILLVVWIIVILTVAGRWYVVAGGVLVFVMSALLITGIYRFEFVKGLGYSAVALLLITGLTWALVKFYPEMMYRRIGAPIGLHGIRFVAGFHKSEAEARVAAVKQYPELGVAGSDFNRRFLAKVAKYRAERPEELRSPGWPLVIAGEVGLEKQFGPLGSPSPATE